MSRAGRRAHRVRAERERTVYPCSHCGAERLVEQLGKLISFERAHPLPGLGEALHGLLSYYSAQTSVSLCPGCMCITGDLSGSHSH